MPTLLPNASTSPAPSRASSVRLSLTSPQVSKTLAKITFSVKGAPTGAVVRASVLLSGKPAGSTERAVTSTAFSARVALTASARKALRKKSRVRLAVVLTVSAGSDTLAEQRFGLTLRRTKAK